MATRDRVLKVKILGDSRDAERAFAKTDKAAGGLSAKFGKLSSAAKLGMAGAGVAVAGFAKASIEAFVEAEQAQKKLEDAFERFPALADTNIKAIRRLATELAKKTRFDDDATAAAAATLAQFGLTGKELRRLIPLVQDFAAKTGQPLESAAEQVGKALLGQGRALKSVGIDFQDTGNKADNLKQVIDGLTTSVGGFAEKEGTTAAGKLAILKNRFGELQEAIGEQLLPVLVRLAEVFEKDVLPVLERVAENLPKIVREIKQAVKLLTGNLGFNMQENFKNITPEEFEKTFKVPSGRAKRREGGGYGVTGDFGPPTTINNNNTTINMRNGATAEETAREFNWRRRGWR